MFIELRRHRLVGVWVVGGGDAVAAAGRGCYGRGNAVSERVGAELDGAIDSESNAVPSAEYLAGTGAMLRMG